MKRGSCRREFVIGPETLAPLLYESRPAQVSEVARGRGLRHSGDVHDIADAHFTAQQQMQNAEPRSEKARNMRSTVGLLIAYIRLSEYSIRERRNQGEADG